MAGRKKRASSGATLPRKSSRTRYLTCAGGGRPKTTGEEPLPADDEPVLADAESLPARADSPPSDDEGPSPENEEPTKKKKSRRHYTEDDREHFFKKYRGLCDDAVTADLPVAEKFRRCDVKYSTGARWLQSCQICFVSYPIIKGNLARCPNCSENLCIPCVSRVLCTQIAEAPRADFRSVHSIKCTYCQHPHAFRPANGDHGRQSRDIPTSVFQAHLVKGINANVDTVNRIGGKLSTELCLLNGRLLGLLKQSGSTQELSLRDCRIVADLDVFARQFGSAAYAQSDLGTAMVMSFRSGKWVKEHSASDCHLDLFMKINDCDYVIEGLSEHVFSLCSAVFARIRHTANIRKNDFFDSLGSIWESRQVERRSNLASEERRANTQRMNVVREERRLGLEIEAADREAAASRERERPVDLTEDTVRGGLDN